ncbi:hypothetical protein [Nonomuraea sp. NPDC049141]|uniref:hypothetical protein n=1 Tax=Nonomuraea sp. NPDC049141 TaxID=3155500 RepID=UPI0033DB1171
MRIGVWVVGAALVASTAVLAGPAHAASGDLTCDGGYFQFQLQSPLSTLGQQVSAIVGGGLVNCHTALLLP